MRLPQKGIAMSTTTKPTAYPPSLSSRAPALCPAWLDRLADAELQQGHHLAAEQLAQRAAELRGAA